MKLINWIKLSIQKIKKKIKKKIKILEDKVNNSKFAEIVLEKIRKENPGSDRTNDSFKRPDIPNGTRSKSSKLT